MRIRATGYDDVTTDVEPGSVGNGRGVQQACNVYVCGAYVGQVIYYARKVATGTEYGWMPEKANRRSNLTSKHDAIARLLAMDGPGRNAAAARGVRHPRNERHPMTTPDATVDRLTELGRQLAELDRQRDLLWDQIRSTAVPALMGREVTLAAVSAAVGFTRKSVTEQLRRHPDYRTRPRAR